MKRFRPLALFLCLLFLLPLAACQRFFSRPDSEPIYADLDNENLVAADDEALYFNSGNQLFSWPFAEKGEPSVLLDDFHGSQLRVIGRKLYYYIWETGDFCYYDLETGTQTTLLRVYDARNVSASSLCNGQWWVKDGEFYIVAPNEAYQSNPLALSIVVMDGEGRVLRRIPLPEDNIERLYCVYQGDLYYAVRPDRAIYAFCYETGEKELVPEEWTGVPPGIRDGQLVVPFWDADSGEYTYALMDGKGRLTNAPELGHDYIYNIDDTGYVTFGSYLTRHSVGVEYPVFSTTAYTRDYRLINGYLCGILPAHQFQFADGVQVQNLTGKPQAEIDAICTPQNIAGAMTDGDRLFFAVGLDNMVYLLNAYNFFDSYNGIYV